MKKILFATVSAAIVLGSFASGLVASKQSSLSVSAQEQPTSINMSWVLIPEKDSFLRSDAPYQKPGDIGFLDVAHNSPRNDIYTANTLLEFNISALSEKAVIHRATLGMLLDDYCHSTICNVPYNTPLVMIAAKQPHTDWSEYEANWYVYKPGSSWTNPGGDWITSNPEPSTTYAIIPDPRNHWVYWDVTSIVQDAQSLSIPVELIVMTPEPYYFVYNSREWWPEDRPWLEIEYTVPVTPTPTPTPTLTPIATPWSFAIITDTHVGERAEDGDFGAPGWDDDGIYDSSYGSDDMSDKGIKSLQSSVAAINQARGTYNIEFLAVLGDLTHHPEPSEMHAVGDVLNTLAVPWVPLIGNHDLWPCNDSKHAPKPEDHGKGNDRYFDTWFSNAYQNFADQLHLPSTWKAPTPVLNTETNPDFYSYFQNFQFDYGGLHFVGLDFVTRQGDTDTGTGPGADMHNFDGGTWDWFINYLESNPVDYDSIILLAHHQIREGEFFYPEYYCPHFNGSEWEIIQDDLSDYKDEILIEFAGHMHNNGWANGPGFKIQCTDKNADHQTVRIVKVFPDGTLDYDTILPEDAASVTAHCPVDLILTDPDGLVVSRTENQIPDAMYDKWDFDEDGLIETDIWIPDRKPGTYSIQVIPESYANESDTFTLTVSPMEHKWGYTPITIAQNVSIADIPAEPYTFEFTQRTATNVSYTGDISGYNSDSINLSAVLSDENGSPVSGKTVNFVIGNQSASATTDTDGMAAVSLMLNQTYSGLCSVEYGFDGDIDYLPYYDAQLFVIPPVADAGGPYTGNEGSPITLDGGGTYDPEDRVISYEWDLDNDGLFDDAAGEIPLYAWNDDYADYIGLKVTDAGGGIGIAITEVTVNNVPPTVTAGADINNVVEGTAANFSGSFTDPGVSDTHTLEWDFGDGSPTINGTLTPSHAYSSSGNYTVTLTVTDDDGGIGTDTLSVNVIPGVVTYTFAGGGGTDKWCSAGHVHLIDWNNGHPHRPSDLAASPTYGFISGSSAEYIQLSSSDDVRWRSDISHCLGCCAFDRNVELFTFKINEDPATVTNIQIKWEGHGTTGETVYYTTEKLWNAASNSWSTLNNKKNITGDITWTNNISSGCSNYIDDSGNLNILLAAQRSGLPKNCGMWTDYIEVTITH